MVAMREVAAEAICSALYNMPFSKHLKPKGPSVPGEWFRLGRDTELTARQDPKQVMVNVQEQDEGVVAVVVSWLNLSGDTVAQGEQTFMVATAGIPQVEVQTATEEVVLRVLDIYQDVLAGTGVAGPIDKIAPESFAGDEEDPDDMAVPE